MHAYICLLQGGRSREKPEVLPAYSLTNYNDEVRFRPGIGKHGIVWT